jgi:hypothetical protein
MRFFLLFLLFIMPGWLFAEEPTTIVVVHEDVEASGINTEKVRDYLLGRTTVYANGKSVIIVLCMDPTIDSAMYGIVDRSVSLLLRGWKRLVFSGAGAMPLQAATVQEAIALVARTPGAITVLPSLESVPKNCRVIPLSTSGK